MLEFGLNVFDGNATQTLGMGDFTLQRLAHMIVPAERASGVGVRNDFILMDVPGYDPARCFVMITPRAYASYPQPGHPDAWGYAPTYYDLGGSRIGIYTYVNRKRPTGVGNNYADEWISHTVECSVEVLRVL
ncbi:hypothetical protein IFU20_16700 [Pseudomonas viridiflava]|uniref:hypothetical protein n=1 Tax=Pseudomonas viridiflava TaxID=33069 RepID=UPI001785FE5F|nr:hypothetical protein [Pseudomonas viridiflava]